jgi:hypothetical protein
MIGADQPILAPDSPQFGPLAADGYDAGPPPQPVRRRPANGTVVAAALIGAPFAIAFVYLAVAQRLGAFGGIAWHIAGALGIPALAVTGAAWCWRRLSRLRNERQPPEPPSSFS